jgi:hypothetical protein
MVHVEAVLDSGLGEIGNSEWRGWRESEVGEDPMFRSILVVIVGYAIFAVSAGALFRLTGQDPHGEASVPFMVGATVYGVAFALLGGYVSGWIARRRPLAHGVAVAVLLALGAGVSLFFTLGKAHVWSQVAALVAMAPAAAFGGWLRGRLICRAVGQTSVEIGR